MFFVAGTWNTSFDISSPQYLLFVFFLLDFTKVANCCSENTFHMIPTKTSIQVFIKKISPKFSLKRNHSFPAAFFWGQNYGSREIFLNTKCQKRCSSRSSKKFQKYVYILYFLQSFHNLIKKSVLHDIKNYKNCNKNFKI